MRGALRGPNTPQTARPSPALAPLASGRVSPRCFRAAALPFTEGEREGGCRGDMKRCWGGRGQSSAASRLSASRLANAATQRKKRACLVTDATTKHDSHGVSGVRGRLTCGLGVGDATTRPPVAETTLFVVTRICFVFVRVELAKFS